MIAPADIDQLDIPFIDRIMAAEVATGLHDGKPVKACNGLSHQRRGNSGNICRLDRKSVV